MARSAYEVVLDGKPQPERRAVGLVQSASGVEIRINGTAVAHVCGDGRFKCYGDALRRVGYQVALSDETGNPEPPPGQRVTGTSNAPS